MVLERKVILIDKITKEGNEDGEVVPVSQLEEGTYNVRVDDIEGKPPTVYKRLVLSELRKKLKSLETKGRFVYVASTNEKPTQ